MKPEDQKDHGEAGLSRFEQSVMDYAKAVNEGRDREAEGKLLELFAIAGAQLMADPSQDMIWARMADECEQIGNWAGAEEARKKALELAKEHPNPACGVKPHLNLASLYEMLGRKEEALAQIETALKLAQKSDIPYVIRVALEAKYSSELGRRDLTGIREAAREGFGVIPNDRIFHLTKARFLLLLARCAAGLGEHEAAESHMAAAREFLGERDQSDFMAGYHWYHSCAAEVSAKIHAARGETDRAIAAFSETVARERTINSRPHLRGIRTQYRLALTLQSFAHYLETGGKTAKAAKTRAEAEEILREMKLPESEPNRLRWTPSPPN